MPLLGAGGFLAMSAESALDAPVRAAGVLAGSFLSSLLFSLAFSDCALTLAFSLLVISSSSISASLGLQLVPTLSSDLRLPSYHTTLSSRPMPCRHDVIRPLGLAARKGKGRFYCLSMFVSPDEASTKMWQAFVKYVSSGEYPPNRRNDSSTID